MSSVKTVIGKRLLVKQVVACSRSAIQLPDSTVQKTFLCMIKKVGKDVSDRATLQQDALCLANPFSREKGTKQDEWFVKESDVFLVKKGSNYHPVGNRILISRLNNTDVKVGHIFIPQAYESSDQTMFGIVFSFGIKNGQKVESVLNIGDIVKIKKWDVSIQEVDIDGGQFLSVPAGLLEYTCDEKTFQDNFIKCSLD